MRVAHTLGHNPMLAHQMAVLTMPSQATHLFLYSQDIPFRD